MSQARLCDHVEVVYTHSLMSNVLITDSTYTNGGNHAGLFSPSLGPGNEATKSSTYVLASNSFMIHAENQLLCSCCMQKCTPLVVHSILPDQSKSSDVPGLVLTNGKQRYRQVLSLLDVAKSDMVTVSDKYMWKKTLGTQLEQHLWDAHACHIQLVQCSHD